MHATSISTRGRQTILTTALTLALLLPLASCGDDNSTTSTAADTSTSTSATAGGPTDAALADALVAQGYTPDAAVAKCAVGLLVKASTPQERQAVVDGKAKSTGPKNAQGQSKLDAKIVGEVISCKPQQ
jgi:hypothetical protein